MWKKTFISAFIAQILSISGFSFALPFLPYFISELGIKDISSQTYWAGIILSSSGFTFVIFSPIWGHFADRYGRKVMVVRSMFAGTLILFLMSIVKTVKQLFVCRLLQGALTGTIIASVTLVASVVPIEKSGFTLGMMQAAVSIGNSVGPLFGGFFADRFGYRITFRIGGLIIFLGGLLVLLFAKENRENNKSIKNDITFKDIFKIKGFWLATIIMFGVRLSHTILNPSFPLVIKEIITSPLKLNTITGIIIGVAAIIEGITAAVLGLIADKIGYLRLIINCSIFASITTLGHFFVNSVSQLFILRILFVGSIAGIVPSVNSLIKKFIKEEAIGKAYGLFNSISMLGLAFGPLIGGYTGKIIGIRAPFLVTSIFHSIVALLIIFQLSKIKRSYYDN
ncbi:MAG: MFS transporter [Candidatus Omnitrophica bacterium]|nr:MFS transporter [Candidatus Omnitrophota bacterium]MCM8810040.1 MFS transporter [Candidatus Omnitrophota bacterium]